MKKFLSILLSFFLFFFVLSWISGFFLDKKPDPIFWKLPDKLNLKETSNTVEWVTPLSNVAGYNWFLAHLMHAKSNLTSHYVNVDSTYYRDSKSGMAIYSIMLGVLTPEMELKLDKLEELKKYYESQKIYDGNKILPISRNVLIWHSNAHGDLFKPFFIDYAGLSERTKKAYKNQFKIADVLLKPDKQGFKTILFDAGVIKEDLRKNFGVNAKYVFLQRVATNLFLSWVNAERENKNSKFRILFVNGNPFYKAGTYTEDVYPTINALLLKQLRYAILNLNKANGFPLGNLAQRLGFAVDVSNLMALWKLKEFPYYKDKRGHPLSLEKVKEIWQQEWISRVPNGTVYERPTQMILASFFAKNSKKWHAMDLGHYPYSRASSTQEVTEQVDVFHFFYEISSMSKTEYDLPTFKPYGYVLLDIPREKLFPIVHLFFKPFVKKYENQFFLKKVGASREEQLYSLRLLQWAMTNE